MRTRAILAALALLLGAACVYSASFTATKLEKQVGGGSTGESLSADPDTSDGFQLSSPTLAAQLYSGEWYVWAMADSAVEYTTEISTDSSSWYMIDRDTVAAGEVENSAVFATGTVSPLYARVILHSFNGPSPYGAAFITSEPR